MIWQFRNPNLRFCCVIKGTKRPVRKNWNTLHAYRLNDYRLREHIKFNKNYGVVGGYGDIVVCDADSQEIANLLFSMLPPTLTVCSALKHLPHFYFYVPGAYNLSIKDDTKTIFDLIGPKHMAIGPESVVDGKEYTIMHDLPIANLSLSVLSKILLRVFPNQSVINAAPRGEVKKCSDPIIHKIRERVSIEEVLSSKGIILDRNGYGDCPFHDSRSKRCFHVSNKLFYCFSCGRGGDVIQLLQDLNGWSFKQTKTWLNNKITPPALHIPTTRKEVI
ncbi:hypothetical protein GF327_09585 [Candidatus Woesearchaeota archaeon]|nr:hypothetical protein [Candidatus Woesearchaeota archaeon]